MIKVCVKFKCDKHLGIEEVVKNFKIINLTHKIFVLNSVFIVVFYAMRLTKQDSTCICFKEFLN
jgi:hypothetical protein